MIRIFLTLLFISSTSFAASTSSDDSATSISASEQVTKLYDKAYELVYYKKFDKSIKLLEKIAKRKDLGEKKADVYNLLGFSYRKHSEPDLDKALESYKIALETNPEHLGAHEYLGELYITLGNMNKANEMLNSLEKIAGTSSMEYIKLKKAIDNTEFNEPSCPIYQNFNSTKTTNLDEIKENLNNQLTSPVLWTQSINNMINDGMLNFIDDYKFGAKSYLVGLGSFLPQISNKFHKHVTNNEVEKANELKKLYEDEYFKLAVSLGWHVQLKEILSYMGLMKRYERAPLEPLLLEKSDLLLKFLNSHEKFSIDLANYIS